MGSFSSKIKVVPYNDSAYYLGNTNKNDIIEGDGKFVDNDGNCYMGKFADDKFNGKGSMLYKDDDFFDVFPVYYKGHWKDNYKDGFGELDFSDGSKYIGNFHLDEIHGKGKFIYSNGSYYEGNFIGGEQVGYGKLFTADGILIYKGNWLRNTYHGQGKYYYTNGYLMYKGNWSYGECHGIGTLYHENGSKNIKAIFENGLISETLQDFNTVVEVIEFEKNIPESSETCQPLHTEQNNISKVISPLRLQCMAVPPPKLPEPANSGNFNNKNTTKEVIRVNPLSRNNNSKKNFLNPLTTQVNNDNFIPVSINSDNSYVVTTNPYNL